MKTNKAVYRKGTFKDYSGIERPYVFCAVSVEKDYIAMAHDDQNDLEFIRKGLHIGLSVVHPDDINRTKIVKVKGVPTEVPVYNPKIGEQIAYGKALSDKRSGSIFSDSLGLINSRVVEAVLLQEEEYFLSHPEKYIAGYEDDRIEYNFEKSGGKDLVSTLNAKLEELKALQKQVDDTYKQSLKK